MEAVQGRVARRGGREKRAGESGTIMFQLKTL